MRATCPANLNDHPNNIWRAVQPRRPSLCSLLQSPVTSSQARASFSSSFSRMPSVYGSSLNVRDQVSHPYKKQQKLRVIIFSSSCFWKIFSENERFRTEWTQTLQKHNLASAVSIIWFWLIANFPNMFTIFSALQRIKHWYNFDPNPLGIEQVFHHTNSRSICPDERELPSLLEGSLPCSQNPPTSFSHEQLRSNFKSPKSVSTRSTL